MLFSLWLIAVVVSATEAKALVENEDSTELPAPAIKDLVDMKTIVMDLDIWQNLTESDFNREGTEMPAIILEGEMLAFINGEEKEKELTTIPATQTEPAPSPESLEVIQVVNKLDDLPTDNIPLITTPSPEELLKQQQMELNEVANNLGAEDILDVISNFIADVDPTLQVRENGIWILAIGSLCLRLKTVYCRVHFESSFTNIIMDLQYWPLKKHNCKPTFCLINYKILKCLSLI